MGYRWLVVAALAAHVSYLAYLVLGGFLTWRWPRAIWPHLAACAWGVAIISFGLDCPLTWAEDQARRRAGLTPLTQGFVDRYLENVIYPPRYVGLARIAVALVVGGAWLGGYLRWRARRDTVRKSAEEPEPAATV